MKWNNIILRNSFITDSLSGNIIFAKLSVSNAFNMVGMEFEDDYKKDNYDRKKNIALD